MDRHARRGAQRRPLPGGGADRDRVAGRWHRRRDGDAGVARHPALPAAASLQRSGAAVDRTRRPARSRQRTAASRPLPTMVGRFRGSGGTGGRLHRASGRRAVGRSARDDGGPWGDGESLLDARRAAGVGPSIRPGAGRRCGRRDGDAQLSAVAGLVRRPCRRRRRNALAQRRLPHGRRRPAAPPLVRESVRRPLDSCRPAGPSTGRWLARRGPPARRRDARGLTAAAAGRRPTVRCGAAGWPARPARPGLADDRYADRRGDGANARPPADHRRGVHATHRLHQRGGTADGAVDRARARAGDSRVDRRRSSPPRPHARRRGGGDRGARRRARRAGDAGAARARRLQRRRAHRVQLDNPADGVRRGRADLDRRRAADRARPGAARGTAMAATR